MKVSRFVAGLVVVVGLALLCMPEISEGQRRGGKRGDRAAAAKPNATEATDPSVPEPDMIESDAPRMEAPGKENKKSARSLLEVEDEAEIRLELKGYNGPMTIEPLVDSGSFVEAGSIIAVLDAERFQEMYEDAELALERAERLYDLNRSAAEQTFASLDMKVKKAEIAAEKANDDWMEFEKFGLHAAVERQEMKLIATRAKIQEAEDELAQLEALYSKNEIAKESEQVVLNRARSRLELQRRDLALDEHEFEHFKEVELPMRRREVQLNLESAQLNLEQAMETIQRYDEQARAEDIKYELAVIAAQRRMSNLDEDTQYISIAAPISGYVFFGGIGKGDFGAYEVGDAIKNGAVIATIADLQTYASTIQVPVAELDGFRVGDVIGVTCKELDMQLDAQIVQRARFAQAGQIALRVVIEDLDGVLMPGLTLAPLSNE